MQPTCKKVCRKAKIKVGHEGRHQECHDTCHQHRKYEPGRSVHVSLPLWKSIVVSGQLYVADVPVQCFPPMSTPAADASHDDRPELAPRKGYHHGALREALLSAARKLIAEKGVAGFTLSDASRLAGVSGAAPYRHFRDKDELVGAVAKDGFTAFAARLEAAATDAKSLGGMNAFQAMGRAYLGFARTEPGSYAAMFGRSVGPGNRELEAAGEAAFAVLLRGLHDSFKGQPPAGLDVLQLAFSIWAISHGMAMLERHHAQNLGIDAEAALAEGVRSLIAPWLAHRT